MCLRIKEEMKVNYYVGSVYLYTLTWSAFCIKCQIFYENSTRNITYIHIYVSKKQHQNLNT